MALGTFKIGDTISKGDILYFSFPSIPFKVEFGDELIGFACIRTSSGKNIRLNSMTGGNATGEY